MKTEIGWCAERDNSCHPEPAKRAKGLVDNRRDSSPQEQERGSE